MQSAIFGVGLIAFGIACTILSIILGFIWGFLINSGSLACAG